MVIAYSHLSSKPLDQVPNWNEDARAFCEPKELVAAVRHRCRVLGTWRPTFSQPSSGGTDLIEPVNSSVGANLLRISIA